MAVVLVDELDVLNGAGDVVGVKDALSVLDTVKVVDDVMLIHYNIEKITWLLKENILAT